MTFPLSLRSVALILVLVVSSAFSPAAAAPTRAARPEPLDATRAGARVERASTLDAPRTSLPFAAGASDGSGGAIVAWVDRRNGVDDDVYVQRLAAPSAEHPDVPQWTPNGVPVCTAFNEQDTVVVASDGAGGAILAWEDARSGLNWKIYAQRVNAEGVPQWTPDGVALCSGPGNQRYPSIAPDGAGGAVVAWQDTRDFPTFDVYAQRVDASGALAWAPGGLRVCATPGNQGGVVTTPADSGSAIIAWVDRREELHPRIYAARIAGDGTPRWTADGVMAAPSTVGPSAIIADGSGGAFLAWTDNGVPDPRVFAQRIDRDGALLWPPAGVDVAPVAGLIGPFTPALARDGAGGLFVASDGCVQRVDASGSPRWGADGLNIFRGAGSAAAAADGAGGVIVAFGPVVQRVDSAAAVVWAPGVVPLSWTADRSTPILVGDGGGGAVLAWFDYRDGELGRDLYAQHVGSDGLEEWTTGGVPIFLTLGLRKNPTCVSDGAGSFIQVWEEKRAGRYVLLARKTNGQHDTVWPAVPLCDANGSQTLPLAVSDGAGGVLVTWTDVRDGTLRYYAQRIDGAGARLWDADGVQVSAAKGDLRQEAIAPDGTGGAVVAWVDATDPNARDVRVQRLDGEGTARWGAYGIPVCAAAGDESAPALAPDGTGGAIAAWLEAPFEAPWRVCAQRIDGDGVVKWDPAGAALCDDLCAPVAPIVVVTDGADGAIVAWQDYRSGAGEIFAQSVDGGGLTRWSPNGVALTTASMSTANPAAVSDGAGGAIVAWSDTRVDSTHFVRDGLYVQRVGAGGAARWQAEGVKLLGSYVTAISGPALIADGAGGAIAAWQVRPNPYVYYENLDIYAQRVDSTGVTLWGSEAASVCAASGPQSLPAMASDGAGGAFFAWQDGRDPTYDDVYTLRLTSAGAVAEGWAPDGLTGTLVSLVCAEASPQAVSLVWSLTGGASSATVHRNRGDGWRALDRVAVNGDGRLRYVDHDVAPGARYGYRLALAENGSEIVAGEVWVEIPACAFALVGARPNPSPGRGLSVRFTLPSRAPATLEVLDVAGRRVFSREVGALGDGPHDLVLSDAAVWRPGLYLVRLRQSGRSLVGRFVILR